MEGKLFEFTDSDHKKKFIIKLVDPKKIEHARRILSGQEKKKVHIGGKIIKEKVNYNPDWSYHLALESMDFFEMAIEVCDSTMQMIEDRLEEVCGAYLPDCHWCPWSSKLVRELDPKL